MKNIKVWAIELFPDANVLYVKSLQEAAEMLVEQTLGDCYEVGDEIEIKITVRHSRVGRREQGRGEHDSGDAQAG